MEAKPTPEEVEQLVAWIEQRAKAMEDGCFEDIPEVRLAVEQQRRIAALLRDYNELRAVAEGLAEQLTFLDPDEHPKSAKALADYWPWQLRGRRPYPEPPL